MADKKLEANVAAYVFEGVWLEIKTANTQFGTLKVLVIPRPFNALFDISRDDFTGFVSQCIVGWNLNNGGKALECSTENKRKYLSVICQWGVENPQYTKAVDGGTAIATVGSEIAAFAGNIDNFTKN